MSTAALPRSASTFGPNSNGILMTPREFDRANFEDGFRYELINGVLIVSPIPLENEADPNGELEWLLRDYHYNHPQGAALDATLVERTVRTPENRRRADRVTWAGLGRLLRRSETPTIIVEFVSEGRLDRERDYETKRDEYLKLGVPEYWIIDRFEQTMTVWTRTGSKNRKRVVRQKQVYRTDLLPSFEVPLARLLAVANRWPGQPE